MDQLPFFGLPQEVIWHIFSFLPLLDFVHATALCKWFNQANSEEVWHQQYNKKTGVEQARRKCKELAKKGVKYWIDTSDYYKPSYHHFYPKLTSTTHKKLLQLREVADDFVVIDFGSYKVRAGLAGEDVPTTVFPAHCGRNSKAKIVGEFTGDFTRPFQNRIVQSIDDLSNLMEYALVDGEKILPPSSSVIVQFARMDKKTKETMTEIAFEQFGLHKFYMCESSVLGLYTSGRTTGVTIDIGYEMTTITPIWEGYAVSYATQLEIGGRHVTAHLKNLAMVKYPQIDKLFTDADFEKMKEKLCYVRDAGDLQAEAKEYKGYLFDDELWQAAEILFNPTPLAVSVMECINNDHQLSRKKDYINNIVVVGGGSNITGLTERLEKDINLISSMQCRIVNSSITPDPTRENYPWVGGSILGSLGGCHNQWWAHKQDYQDQGIQVVSKFYQ